MTTQTNAKSGTPTLDAAYDQVTGLNERFLAAARKAGNLYVDSYEKAVTGATNLQLQLAERTDPEWLKSLVDAQVGYARELTSSYATAARTLIK